MKLLFPPLSITSFNDIIIFCTFLREINTFFSKVKHRLLPVNLFCYTLISSQAAWQVHLSHLIQRVENVLSCFLRLDFGFSFMFTTSLSRTKRKKKTFKPFTLGATLHMMNCTVCYNVPRKCNSPRMSNQTKSMIGKACKLTILTSINQKK